jgi:hypothetical protein
LLVLKYTNIIQKAEQNHKVCRYYTLSCNHSEYILGESPKTLGCIDCQIDFSYMDSSIQSSYWKVGSRLFLLKANKKSPMEKRLKRRMNQCCIKG